MSNRTRGAAKPKLLIAVAVIAILAVVVVVMSFLGGEPETVGGVRSEQVYFMNVGTGTLFKAKSTDIPPIDVPDSPGAEGVRAYMYGCGSCAEPFIGYVEKWTPAGKTAMLQVQSQSTSNEPIPLNARPDPEAMATGKLVARPAEGGGELEWVGAHEPDGEDIIAYGDGGRCESGNPVKCDRQ